MCATCGCGAEHGHEHDGRDGREHVQLRAASGDQARARDRDAPAYDHARSRQHATHEHPHADEHPHAHSHEPMHATAHDHAHADEHAHAHDQAHSHDHADSHDRARSHDDPHADAPAHANAHDREPARRARTIAFEQAVLMENDRRAAENRAWLAARAIACANIMGSPGCGKTTLLERTIRDLASSLAITVIEGDQQTARDAERIRAAGARAVQINTGAGCHLDASMIARGLRALAPPPRSLVLVENVGNLVCPALFDLGERRRVVLASIVEGEDKPLKYPHMFRAADVMVVTKLDLAPHARADVDRLVGFARAVKPQLEVFRISAVTGDGLEAWYRWLRVELCARPA
jgi:hydrogenase nickel incorporation protein HypB